MMGFSNSKLSRRTFGLVGIKGALATTNRLAGVIEFCFFFSSSKLSSTPWSPLPSYCIFMGMLCRFPGSFPKPTTRLSP